MVYRGHKKGATGGEIKQGFKGNMNMQYVGVFSEEDIRNGKDKVEVEKMKSITGLQYTNTKITKNGLKIWVCTVDEMEI